MQALHKMAMTLAQCYHGQGSGVKCDEANRQMLSHSLQQLVQLTAHLLVALPLDARHHLAQSLLQVSSPSSSTLGQHLSHFLPLVRQGQSAPSQQLGLMCLQCLIALAM